MKQHEFSGTLPGTVVAATVDAETPLRRPEPDAEQAAHHRRALTPKLESRAMLRRLRV
jgi:hypothetical protein